VASRAELKAGLRKSHTVRTDLDGLSKHLKVTVKRDLPIHYNTVRKLLVIDTFGRVILRSPVDEGLYRASHTVSVRLFRARTPRSGARASQGAAMTASEEARGFAGLVSLADADVGSAIWLGTNMPQSQVIEHGEYPDPPKRGSYIRRGRPGAPGYFKLSKGGFSRQAPRGVYGISTTEAVRALQLQGA
jgi:hypothetical protein